MRSSRNFIRRLLTLRVYALDSMGRFWIAHQGDVIMSSVPIELLLLWDDARLYLDQSFTTLIEKAPIHTVVTSIEFGNTAARDQPLPRTWRIERPALSTRLFREYLEELFVFAPLEPTDELPRKLDNALPRPAVKSGSGNGVSHNRKN
jgi:hypothetical protein